MRNCLVFVFLFLLCGCKPSEDFTSTEIIEVENQQPINFIPFSTKSIELDGPASTDPSVATNAMALMGAMVPAFSFSFWFKMKVEDGLITGGYIRSNFDTENFFAVGWDNGTKTLRYACVFGNGGPTANPQLTVEVPNPREWNHVVFSYSHDSAMPTTNRLRLYLNGQLVEEQAPNGDIFQFIASRRIEILPNGYNMAPSYFDEMAFWRRELSLEEVTILYGKGAPSNLAESLSDYTAWWRMGESDKLPTISDETRAFDFDFQILPSLADDFAIAKEDPFAGDNSSDPLNDDSNGDGTSGGGGSDPFTGGSGGFGGELGDGTGGNGFP